MKTITIDFELYEKEKKELKIKTHKQTMNFAKSLLWIGSHDFKEKYNNAIYEDDRPTMDFLEECYPDFYQEHLKSLKEENEDEKEKAKKIFDGNIDVLHGWVSKTLKEVNDEKEKK